MGSGARFFDLRGVLACYKVSLEFSREYIAKHYDWGRVDGKIDSVCLEGAVWLRGRRF